MLDAAQRLAGEAGGVRHVTLLAVTEAAGVHPSGVRRYFENKQELLLELAERGWGNWRELVLARIEGAGSLSAAEVAEVLARTLAAQPLFCDLLAHVPLDLEGEVSLERVERFKTASFASHDAIVEALAAAGGLDTAQVADLITTAICLAASLWQVSHPTDTLAELYRRHPAWGHVALEFEPRLVRLLRATALGLVDGGSSR